MDKNYQVITDELVLFNDEYYLKVLRLPLAGIEGERKKELFDTLFAFSSDDIEMEIDVSEEADGVWYLQLLVPHVLTLPEVALRRITRGTEALQQYLIDHDRRLTLEDVVGDNIYTYVKRYNPNLNII